MAKNIFLLPKTQLEIDDHVNRIIKGLGNPEPPLKLEDVRQLLRLDLGFYSATDPGLAREVVNKLKVATLQVLERPTLIFDAIKAFSLKALYLPDRKRILLDSDVPVLKHRWNEAHEIGHSLLPWHESMMHGDTEHTLSRACEAVIETEANFAAGRLLFMRDRFFEEMNSRATGIEAIRELRKVFGNTIASTLYRYVEAADELTPMVGLMSCHPHASKRPADFNPLDPCKHLIQSSAFRRQFGKISEMELFAAVANYCGSQSGGFLGRSELVLNDDNGVPQSFYFETFYNRYDALTLGVYRKKKPTVIAFSRI